MNGVEDRPLDFHDDILGLCGNMKKVAAGVLRAQAPEELHQPFLDELAVIVQERPTRSPVVVLCHLIRNSGKGRFALDNPGEDGS